MNKFIFTILLLFAFTQVSGQTYIAGKLAGLSIVNSNLNSTSLICDTSFSFPTVDNWPGGLTFDGTYFYSIAHDSTTVIRYDVTGQYSGHFALPSISSTSAGDLSFDGTNLWAVVEQDDMLYKVDQNSGTVLASFPLPTAGVSSDYYGCAYDNGSIWISHYADELLLKLDAATGTVLNTFNINRWVLPLTIINGDLWGVDFINNSASGPMQLVKFNKSTGAVTDSIDWCLDYSLGVTVANGNVWGLSSGINLGTARIYGFESLLLSLFQESDNSPGFTLFPNPAHQELSVRSVAPFELEVVTINGSVVIKEKVFGDHITLDISNLANDIYLIKIISQNTASVRKFIKH